MSINNLTLLQSPHDSSNMNSQNFHKFPIKTNPIGLELSYPSAQFHNASNVTPTSQGGQDLGGASKSNQLIPLLQLASASSSINNAEFSSMPVTSETRDLWEIVSAMTGKSYHKPDQDAIIPSESEKEKSHTIALRISQSVLIQFYGKHLIIVHRLNRGTCSSTLFDIFFPFMASEAVMLHPDNVELLSASLSSPDTFDVIGDNLSRSYLLENMTGIVVFPSHDLALIAQKKMNAFRPRGQSQKLRLQYIYPSSVLPDSLLMDIPLQDISFPFSQLPFTNSSYAPPLSSESSLSLPASSSPPYSPKNTSDHCNDFVGSLFNQLSHILADEPRTLGVTKLGLLLSELLFNEQITLAMAEKIAKLLLDAILRHGGHSTLLITPYANALSTLAETLLKHDSTSLPLNSSKHQSYDFSQKKKDCSTSSCEIFLSTFFTLLTELLGNQTVGQCPRLVAASLCGYYYDFKFLHGTPFKFANELLEKHRTVLEMGRKRLLALRISMRHTDPTDEDARGSLTFVECLTAMVSRWKDRMERSQAKDNKGSSIRDPHMEIFYSTVEWFFGYSQKNGINQKSNKKDNDTASDKLIGGSLCQEEKDISSLRFASCLAESGMREGRNGRLTSDNVVLLGPSARPTPQRVISKVSTASDLNSGNHHHVQGSRCNEEIRSFSVAKGMRMASGERDNRSLPRISAHESPQIDTSRILSHDTTTSSPGLHELEETSKTMTNRSEPGITPTSELMTSRRGGSFGKNFARNRWTNTKVTLDRLSSLSQPSDLTQQLCHAVPELSSLEPNESKDDEKNPRERDTTLYLCQIPCDLPSWALRLFLEYFGPVSKVRLREPSESEQGPPKSDRERTHARKSHPTSKSRLFGFVEFASPVSLDRLLKFHPPLDTEVTKLHSLLQAQARNLGNYSADAIICLLHRLLLLRPHRARSMIHDQDPSDAVWAISKEHKNKETNCRRRKNRGEEVGQMVLVRSCSYGMGSSMEHQNRSSSPSSRQCSPLLTSMAECEGGGGRGG